MKRAERLGRRHPLAAVGTLLPLALVAGLVLGRLWHHAEVLPGVWVNELALSGLDRPRLQKDLAAAAERLNQRPVRVHLEGVVFSFQPEQIDTKLDVAGTADLALAAGRDGGFWFGLGWSLARLVSSHEISFRATYDQRKLEALVEKWERAAIPDPPVPGEVRVQGGRLVAEPPRVGRHVDRARLQRELAAVLGRAHQRTLGLGTAKLKPKLTRAHVQRALDEGNRLVQAPLQLASRDGKLLLSLTREELVRSIRSRPRDNPARLEVAFDAEAIGAAIKAHKERLEQEPQNASFRVDRDNQVSIVPGKPGTRLDPATVAEALMRAAHAPGHVGELPVQRDALPEFSTEDARALNIVKLVARFSTGHACCQPRVQNIHRIAEIMDGTVVKPGQVFSVNEHVGPRTKANGFVPAPTIVEGDMEDTVGGGVSQFATTLFNALLKGGYDIIERQPHSYWFPRYPMGHEATLSYPKPDIIFRNDTKSGLLIKTEYSQTRIVVKLFGDDEGRKVKTTVSRRQDIIDPPIELVADPSVEPDEEKVLDAGMVGWSVIAGRTITFKEKPPKTEKRKVTYMPRARRVRVHPCRIPEGEEGYTGEDCPEPEDAVIEDEELSVETRAGKAQETSEQPVGGENLEGL